MKNKYMLFLLMLGLIHVSSKALDEVVDKVSDIVEQLVANVKITNRAARNEEIKVWCVAPNADFEVTVKPSETKKVAWYPSGGSATIYWKFVKTKIADQFKFPDNTRHIYLYDDELRYYYGSGSDSKLLKW